MSRNEDMSQATRFHSNAPGGRPGRVAQVVNHLPGKCEAMGPTPGGPRPGPVIKIMIQAAHTMTDA
jgi:hypothetical protein